MAKYIKKRNLINIYISDDEDIANIKKYIDQKIIEEERLDNWIYIINESFYELNEELKQEIYNIIEEYRERDEIQEVLIIEKPKNINPKYIKELKKNGIRNVEMKAYSSNRYILSHIKATSFKKIEDATKALRFRRMKVFLEMQIGLPESNELDELQTAKSIAKLKPSLVKITPTVVYKDTILEEKYKNIDYRPMTIEEAVVLTKKLINYFKSKKIEEIQIGFEEYDQVETNIYRKKESGSLKISQNPKYIEGPYDENFNFFVYSSLYYDMILDIIKGYNVKVKEIEIEVNPQISKYVLGFNNSNFKELKRLYDIDAELKQSLKLSQRDIKIKVLKSYSDFIDE